MVVGGPMELERNSLVEEVVVLPCRIGKNSHQKLDL
jgi:hypothetical protein